MITRPMKAPTDTPSEEFLRGMSYPRLVSPKIDGIRCLNFARLGAVSSTFKPIPNDHIRDVLNTAHAWYLDGELITLTDKKFDSFNTVQSKVMTITGKPSFLFLVFDYFESTTLDFEQRLAVVMLKSFDYKKRKIPIVYLPHRMVYNYDELVAQEALALSRGLEGLMIRHPQGKYKSGRATAIESSLFKLKRYKDAEGTVVGFKALERNLNAKEADNFGLAKRSSHKSGKQAVSLLGTLTLKTEFGIIDVSGFTDAMKKEIWNNQDKYLGQTVTYKYFPYGMKDKPRQPIFKSFRHKETM